MEKYRKDRRKPSTRSQQIEFIRRRFSFLIKGIIVVVIYYMVFDLFYIVFRLYQNNVDGIEWAIRYHGIGPITGFQPEWEDNLYNIRNTIFSPPFFILLYISMLIEAYRLIKMYRIVPALYRGFFGFKRIIMENFIIPLGILVGLFLGFFIYLFVNEYFHYGVNSDRVYLIFGLIPFIFISICTLAVFLKGTKGMKIKYIITIVLVLFFQF